MSSPDRTVSLRACPIVGPAHHWLRNIVGVNPDPAVAMMCAGGERIPIDAGLRVET